MKIVTYLNKQNIGEAEHMRPTIGFQKKQRRHAQAPTQHAIVSLTHRSFALLLYCTYVSRMQSCKKVLKMPVLRYCGSFSPCSSEGQCCTIAFPLLYYVYYLDVLALCFLFWQSKCRRDRCFSIFLSFGITSFSNVYKPS